MKALSPAMRTVLASLGVVGLVAVSYVTYLLTVVYRPIDAYSITYQVTGGSGPVSVEYSQGTGADRTQAPTPAPAASITPPWSTEVIIPAGAEAKIAIATPPAGLTCVIIQDKGRGRERVLASRTAEPGQPLVCTARTPTGETLNAAPARPTPR
ncbi:hypothetical protein [Crossiella cryophila]|uniref:Uncharacterized protein n=1 Tax=Crossiella cryophila TaxID=43355 RepID=A0A7W7CKB8_9PSEU|nr:hypothetical protein [Crossiella cryophila]MBB4681348.1 hypothetical protein [Crossiella cryophila]